MRLVKDWKDSLEWYSVKAGIVTIIAAIDQVLPIWEPLLPSWVVLVAASLTVFGRLIDQKSDQKSDQDADQN